MITNIHFYVHKTYDSLDNSVVNIKKYVDVWAWI